MTLLSLRTAHAGRACRRITAGVAVLALAACAPALQAPPLTADASPPAGWVAATPETPADAYSYADTDWVTDFRSEALSALIAEALAHNRDLRAAAARVAQARARARAAGADLWPQLSLGVTGSGSRVGLKDGGTTTESYGVGADISWEVDLWGRLASSARSAALTAEATARDEAAARLSLAGQVADGWFGAIAARQQRDLARETVTTYERAEHLVRARTQAGLTSELDLKLAISNLESARALARLRDQQFGEARRRLEVLLGRYPAASVETAAQLPALAGVPATGVPADVLARRPDLQAGYTRLMAAGYGVASARRALLPRLTLTGSIGDEGASLADAFDFHKMVATLVGQLTQPVFQGGRLRANVDLAKATRDESVQTYAQSVLVAFREVEDALGAEAQLGAREAALATSAQQAAAAERLAELQYTNGLTSILTLLDAQRRNLDAQSQLLDARLARLTSRVRLHVALGGSLQPPSSQTQG